MSKKTKHQAQAAAEPQRSGGVAGYLMGGALGVVILALLALITHKPPVTAILEYPQLTVLVELEDLGDPGTREALTRLQRDLEALGLVVRGPASYPVLLPGADGAPQAKRLDALTRDELAEARRYFGVGGYLVPRVYSEDLKTAILRAAPAKGGRFLPGTRREVERVIDAFRTEGVFAGLWPYSYDLRLVEPEAQARTNVVFGVQTANVLLVAKEAGKLEDVHTLLALDAAADVLKNQGLRSVVTPGSWYRYAEAVRARDPKFVIPGELKADLAASHTKLAVDNGLPPLVHRGGATGMVEVTTQAEGKENLDLCWFVAANLNHVKGVRAVVERERD